MSAVSSASIAGKGGVPSPTEDAFDPGERRSAERFLCFTDAVVAIAITLLVLPLTDVVHKAAVSNRSVSDILRENGSVFLGFLISFAVILGLWSAHSRVFQSVMIISPSLKLAAIVWLVGIVLLPFTTALIAELEYSRLGTELYIVNIGVCSGALSVACWVLLRTPALGLSTEQRRRRSLRNSVINTGLSMVTLSVAVLFPQLQLWVMVIMWMFSPVSRALDALGSRSSSG